VPLSAFQVAAIDVLKETPVGHGRIICFSVYCGEEADFGDGTKRLWVDLIDDGEGDEKGKRRKAVLGAFKDYLKSESIRKVCRPPGQLKNTDSSFIGLA
jgi:DNA polymerase-1